MPVAMGDTIESVRVKFDAVTNAPRNLRATDTFAPLPAGADVCEVMRQALRCYDNEIPVCSR